MPRQTIKVGNDVFHFERPKPDGKLTDFYRPHLAVGMDAGGPSLTRQDMAEECDVNNIMQRYEATGFVPTVSGQPFYADFTSVPDNMIDAMQQMSDATAAFMTLPARVRKEFDNDPALFVDFASNPDNLDQLREWELAPPAPQKAPELPPAASPASPGAPPPAPAQGPLGQAKASGEA